MSKYLGQIIAGTKTTKRHFILKFKDSTMYHRVPARTLIEAKGKMLKGTRYTFQDVIQLKRGCKK